jgi:DNA-binding MurR/RpiR family transcriptional regulator
MAFGFARYPKETIKILGFFRKRNFRIISITDNNLSPLARLSDIVLTIPCESISFTDFFAVPMSLVNILVISVSQLDEETSLKHLNEFENIAKDMGFYF